MTTTQTSADVADFPPVGSVRKLAQSGAIAGVIKLGSAGLSFLMFLAVAFVTDERQFGLYGAAYAGASLASFFNTFGQQSAVLRFWPEYASAGDYRTAQSFMARSLLVAGGGAILSAVIVGAIAFIPWFHEETPEWLPLMLSSALLSAGLGWSEVASGAVRAKGYVVSALLPRDIFWRALLIGIVAVLWALGVEIDAVQAVLLSGITLIVAVAPQGFRVVSATIGAERAALSAAQKHEFAVVTSGLWGVTSLPPALAQVSTLLVAALLGPEIAGAVFVADRTTRLVLLALTGINQALAPEISTAYYSGNKERVQTITSLTALGATLTALLMVMVFAIFGQQILWVFDPAYARAEFHVVLLTFAVGAAVMAACGPIELLSHLTGLQHALLKVLVVGNAIGLAVTAVATWTFGPEGAAAGIAGTLIVWNLVAVGMAQRRIGINSSVLGIVRVWRQRGGLTFRSEP